MKQSIFIVILFALLSESGFSQIPISPVPISVGYSKTTSLIFTYPIVLVDIGSAAVLGKIPKRTSNILELKATSKNFAQTNASVVTSDGQFYAFTLNFGANADSLCLRFPRESEKRVSGRGHAQLSNPSLQAARLTDQAIKVQSTRGRDVCHVYSQQLKLTLKPILVDSQTLWFYLVLSNNSRIPFHPDHIRIVVQDRKHTKRTAIQETERFPIFRSLPSTLYYQQSAPLILSFPSFTISKHQRLKIQIGETNDSRALSIIVGSKTVLKALPLPN